MAKPRIVNTLFNDETVFFGEYTNHLLAEGDSWFAWSHLNLAPSSNILEQFDFRDATVIVNLAYSGDVIRNMSTAPHNMHFYFELQGQPYHAILLSGGGNDLIDALAPDGNPGIIVPCGESPADAADSYIDAAALTVLTDDVLASYRRIIAMRDASDANADTPIVLHTYDYPTPRNAKAKLMGQPAQGPWLLPAVRAAGVPVALNQDVTAIVFDALADALLTLHQPQNGVYVVSTRNTLARAAPGTTGLSGDWINEIHPDAHGYSLLARKLAVALADLDIE